MIWQIDDVFCFDCKKIERITRNSRGNFAVAKAVRNAVDVCKQQCQKEYPDQAVTNDVTVPIERELLE